MNWKPALAGGIIVALLGIGAGLLIDGGGGETTTTVVETTTEEAPTETETRTETPTTAETTTTQAPDVSALASSQVSLGGTPLRLDVTGLSRQGEGVVLRFSLVNESADDRTFVDLGSREFGDQQGGFSVAADAADGITLLDPASGTQYRVARSSEEGCLCSKIDYKTSINAGASVQFFATFADVPQHVTQADITFPGRFGSLPGIPID